MKKSILFTIITLPLIVIITGCGSSLDDTSKIELKTRMDTISYIIGLDYGQGIKDQSIEANALAIYKGVDDGLNDTSFLTDSIKNKIIAEFQQELKISLEEKGKKDLAENKQKGAEFLNENKNKEGVIQLPSGLQYKMLKEGIGANPTLTDSVLIHYRAMFIDRTTFDMSYDRGPTGVKLSNVIKGLSDGIQLMKPGSICELYIPPELGYGDQVFANIIPAGSTMIYSIELISIE